MVPSYVPLETKQLLFETFFSPGFGFRDIRLDGLKWATLYVYIYICVINIINNYILIIIYYYNFRGKIFYFWHFVFFVDAT